MTQPEAADNRDKGTIERVSSFVPGLDVILGGGFLRGGLYMIKGTPGMGKTILASQIIYSQEAGQSRTLFVTVLGENHGRMMMHLRSMRFFDEARIPDQVFYISAYGALEDEGLKGLVALIRREVVARGATMLVLDGLSAVEAKAGAEYEMKRFTHDLQTLASATDCTMFLLTTASGTLAAPEHTMVDGLIELRHRSFGSRAERRLLVHKIRGTGYLEGEHAFGISDAGVTVFPRIEALLAMPSLRAPPPTARLSSGVASLDEMFGGGIPAATLTGLVGPSGSGKTTLGLHFLSGSSASEPGLLFGCYEPPERLRYKATTMGFDLAAAEQRGDVEILWYPVGEHILDELAHALLDAVRRRGVKRLVIDGLSGFQQAALEPERIVRFWSALSNELRARDVTTLHTLELQELAGPEIRIPISGIASLAEVMVLVRYVELRSRLYRLISMSKVREGAFDPTIREFEITDAGVVVGKPFEGVEAVLSGMARAVSANAYVASSEASLTVPPDAGTGRTE
ncbi:ATPase domain-containing protein [Lichenifustis flavocetrariae]|uniref:non-specific serine/threonine protein kinase n=1 Tax=Lichenifustis flavocetrariae TaxID=2949735 RepID=A0AA42CN36_9HYPH|nr:ATPase domain-containing protein [Lichenifustis flavocetrariae]MCW6512286.1 AAA family ATPase [Lichenifustis flavocetrariae]